MLDSFIRSYIKRILELPRNFANELLYLRCKNGGLGIIQFASKLPLLKVNIYQKLLKSDDPVTASIIRDEVWSKDYERQRSAVERLTGQPIRSVPLSKRELETAYLSSLSRKVQGFGAQAFANNPGNFWLGGMTPGWQGRQCLTALRLRSNTIVTRESMNRGRVKKGDPRLLCRHGCRVVESQAHILQKCYKVKGARIERHHAVVKELSRVAKLSGMEVEEEKSIVKPDGSTIRPDLILRRDNCVSVVDVTIAYEFSEHSLREAAVTKTLKYDCLRDLLRERDPTVTTVSIEGFVVGARGSWYEGNDLLLKSLKISKVSRKMVGIVLRASCSMISKFMDAKRLDAMNRPKDGEK